MMPTGLDPKHLLWALYFLLFYDTEHNSYHSLGKMDEKTHQTWLGIVVVVISYLVYVVVRFIPSNVFLFIEPCPQIILCSVFLADSEG